MRSLFCNNTYYTHVFALPKNDSSGNLLIKIYILAAWYERMCSSHYSVYGLYDVFALPKNDSSGNLLIKIYKLAVWYERLCSSPGEMMCSGR